MPRQPSSSTSRPSTSRAPEKRASGYGLRSFVRGSGARYIQARGRWLQRLLGRVEGAGPTPRGAPPPPRSRPPCRSPAPRRRSGCSSPRRAPASGSVCFTAPRPVAPSKSVNHSEPVGRRARALVHRVADPHAQRLRRVAGLEVEALVVAGPARDRREAGRWVGGRHGRATPRHCYNPDGRHPSAPDHRRQHRHRRRHRPPRRRGRLAARAGRALGGQAGGAGRASSAARTTRSPCAAT